MFIAILYIIIIIFFTWKYPIIGISITTYAFVINAISRADGIEYILIGVGGPLSCFITIILKQLYLKKSFYIPIYKEDLLVILLFFILLHSVLYTQDFRSTLIISIRYLSLCLSFYLAVKFVLYNSNNREKDIFIYLCATVFISLFFAIYAWVENVSPSRYVYRLSLGDRAGSIILSLVVSQAILIVGYIVIKIKNKKYKLLLLFPLAILLYVEILANTRSTMIGLVIATVLLLFLNKKSISYLKLGTAIFTGIIIINLLSLDSRNLHERSFTGLKNIISGNFSGTSDQARIQSWTHGLEVFSDNYFFGVGHLGKGGYVHNIFIELLSRNGLIGFVVFCCFIFLAIKKVFYYKKSDVYFMVSSLFILNLFFSQVSATLWMHKNLFIWIAMLFTNDKKYEKKLRK